MASQKVVIVGAGVSGYSAGVDLMKNGFDVTILEAEGRIGGRVNSVEIDPGKYIDFGAQWVHGQQGNTIYEFIGDNFKYGSSRYGTVEMNWLSSSDKNFKLNETEINAVWKMGWSIIDNEDGEMSKFNGNIEEYFDKFYNEQLKDEKYAHVSSKTSEVIRDLIKKAVMGLYAANSCSEISSRFTAKFMGETSGDNYLTWRTEGYKTVFDFISGKRPDSSKHVDIDSKIEVNKKVTNIKWNPEGKNEKVDIVCADGSKYETDHVIFTASAGVLKARHTKMFTPNLPADKVKAIEGVGYGPLGKLFIEFDIPFWPINDEFIGYYFLWDSNDLKDVQKTDKAWLLGTLGFYIVDAYPNLIEFFFVGKATEQLESLSLEKIEGDILWLLQKFMNLTPPKPKRLFRTNWISNENFLGAYSFVSSRVDEHYSPATLARPLKDASGTPKILFAGEATSSDFSGYVNGAASTGWRAAKELIEANEKH